MRNDGATLVIHYHRYIRRYDGWSLWIWCGEHEADLNPVATDDYGALYKLDLSLCPSGARLGVLPKYGNWKRKDAPERYLEDLDVREVWLLEGDGRIFHAPPEVKPFIRRAFLDSPAEILLYLTGEVDRKTLNRLEPKLTFHGKSTLFPAKVELHPDRMTRSSFIRLSFSDRIEPGALPATVHCTGYKPAPLELRYVLDDPEYTTDARFGVHFDDNVTEFSVYSPAADKILLNIWHSASGGSPSVYEMIHEGRGVWRLKLPGDFNGKYYTYTVELIDQTLEPADNLVDPCAECVTAYNGRGLIIRDSTPVAGPPDFPLQDAIIYEAHIRDFTIDTNSGSTEPGSYRGFVEPGTKIPGTDIATGIDHLLELGVNTVQLMPVQCFEHDPDTGGYFWGYMPVHLNSPEGWYASIRDNSSRVRELKYLVDRLHRNGIKVVLDVVYNHTAETARTIRYNFNGFIPDFYYRQREDGSYWNGSGCGNEFRTENPMVRRFILDSLIHWVTEYKIDGFRFDLMGLFDMDTMTEIVQVLQKINPQIFLYGEPWIAGDTPVEPLTKGKQKNAGFAVFNDHFRDALRGPWFKIGPGHLQSGINSQDVKKGIAGSIDDFTAGPDETINYAECHDGRTLWDRLKITTETDPDISGTDLRQMAKLAAAIILTSQGIPFVHGGQEFLRSKGGSHNSYKEPDRVNMIQWMLKQKNEDIFDYFRGLIRLRKEHPMFRFSTPGEIQKNLAFLDETGFNVPEKCIAYRLDRGNSGDNWSSTLNLINPTTTGQVFRIPAGKWALVVDHITAGTDRITSYSGSRVKVQPRSMMVLYRM